VTRSLTFLGRAERKLIWDFGGGMLHTQDASPSRRGSGARRKSSGVIGIGGGLREALEQANKGTRVAPDEVTTTGRTIGEQQEAFLDSRTVQIGLEDTEDIVLSPKGELHSSPRRMSRQMREGLDVHEGPEGKTPRRRMSLEVPSILAERWEKEKKEKNERVTTGASNQPKLSSPVNNDKSPRYKSRKALPMLRSTRDPVESEPTPAPHPEEALQEALGLAASVQEKLRSKAEWSKLFKEEQKLYNSTRAQEQQFWGPRRKRGAGIFIQTTHVPGVSWRNPGSRITD